MKATLLNGQPGVGKTSLCEYYADLIDAQKLYYLCHEWTTNEELLHTIDVAKLATKNKDPYKRGILWKAIELSQKEKVVVIIDELDKAREKVDTLLLDFVQNCRTTNPDDQFVYGKSENIWLFVTTNEKRQLTDALLRRMFKMRIQHLPPDIEKKLMAVNNSEYFIDKQRQFLINYLNLTEFKELTETQQGVINIVHSAARSLRKAKLDISLYEMKNFLLALSLCTDNSDVEMLVFAWLVRDEEYEKFLNREHKSIRNFANNIWGEYQK